jgi:hypothetical protein
MNAGLSAEVRGAQLCSNCMLRTFPPWFMLRQTGHVLVLVMLTGSLGCKPGPTPLALIHYSQLGACTRAQTGNGVINVPPNHAVVIFRVTQIDNTSPSVSWSFDSTRLTVNGADNQQNLGGTGSVPIAAHQKVNLNTHVGIMVETTNADGTDASTVNYFLLYPPGTSAPGTVAVKANSSQVSYPFTQDCSAIAGK